MNTIGTTGDGSPVSIHRTFATVTPSTKMTVGRALWAVRIGAVDVEVYTQRSDADEAARAACECWDGADYLVRAGMLGWTYPDPCLACADPSDDVDAVELGIALAECGYWPAWYELPDADDGDPTSAEDYDAQVRQDAASYFRGA